MSETDDTDVLLLIKPGFFLVRSSGSEDSLLESSRTVVHKPISCTAKVLDKLVDQVHSLETRLDSLEVSVTSDTVSSLSSCKNNWESNSIDKRSVDRKCSTFPRRRRRKQFRREVSLDLSLTSLDSASTYKNNIPPLVKEQTNRTYSTPCDTPMMDEDLSSITSTPSKKNDRLLLHEIDDFLTKVETYESPETKYKTHEVLSSENVIKATGDYITSQMDTKTDDIVLPSGKTISNSILDKYIYLVKSATEKTDRENTPKYHDTHTTSQLDATSKSNQDGAQKVLETKNQSMRRLNFTNKDVQPTSTPKKQPSKTDSFRPSSNKIYDRATKVLEQYKSQSYSSNPKSSLTDTSLSSRKRDEFKIPQMRPYVPENKDIFKFAALQNKFMETIDTDLLSLSELWGEKGERVERVDSGKLEEERLKREHCEGIIQQLQKKLLEQQERLAVAIKVDKAKDAAIAKLKEAWLKLTGSLDNAEERHRSALEKMVREVDNFKSVADDAQRKTNHFEAELYKALDLAHDYQEKCKSLTIEKNQMKEQLEKNISCQEESSKTKEKEIEMLKDNCETVMRLNKQSTDCVKKLEEALEKEKTEHEQTKNNVVELKHKMQSLHDDITLVREEKEILKVKVNEERARCNIIETQLGEKQNQTSDLLQKCDMLDSEVKSLRKQMELQKNELKAHYQKQLEGAVMSKLQEFQQQLDTAEREIENDARMKENNTVDTFNKQISRIEEQHKFEINILEEKHKEEIKLYRLQLAQASEKINLVEGKLWSVRRRRGQVAAQLHAVMQAQWRQALLILTRNSDPGPGPAGSPAPAELGAPSGGAAGAQLEGLSDHDLQQYVQLLLTKPPLDGSGDCATSDRELGELPEEPTSDRPERRDRRENPAKRSLLSKPPWKS